MSLRSPVPRGGLGDRGEGFPGGERVAELLGKVGLGDEPAGNLDTTSGTDIMGVFLDLWRSGSTLVVIAHDRALARRASRIVEIRHGWIVSDRPAAEAA